MKSMTENIHIIMVIIICACLLQSAAAKASESPEGTIVMVKGGNLWTHDLATGKEKKLTTDGTCDAPQVSPDSRFILCWFPLGGQSSKIFIYTLDGSAARVFTGGNSPCWDTQKK